VSHCVSPSLVNAGTLEIWITATVAGHAAPRSCAIITHDALRILRNMKNPFQYGGIVSGPAFCNRKKELADLTAANRLA
jgi:hypothetical protein